MVARCVPNSLSVTIVLLLCVTPEAVTGGEQSAPEERPTTEPRSCAAGECHSEVKDFTVLHGPLNVDSCAGCHRLQDAKKHTFTMARSGNRLCLFCHRMDTGAVTHLDKGKGSCLECHNPHGGRQRGLLTTKTAGELCLQCHEQDMEKGGFEHGPVTAGGCMACHAPHASDQPKLLLKEARVLCLDCHVSLSHNVEWSPVVHEPMNRGCLECHHAHASKERMLLRQTPRRLCLSCHDDVRSTVEQAKTPHGALVEGRQCLNCHDAHAAGFPHLLRNNARSLCLECHNKPIETPRGMIRNVGEVLATGESLHGPIGSDNCSACHQIHGGHRFRLLVKEYPSEFYAPFREESYALCFSCHERSIFLSPRATALTGFRNGEYNLHFAHVNRKTKGRTCRACHEIHSGDRDKQVREFVPFGVWKLPVGFEKTETGGECSPGCHLRLRYDRRRPVSYDHGEDTRFVDWPAPDGTLEAEKGNP